MIVVLKVHVPDSAGDVGLVFARWVENQVNETGITITTAKGVSTDVDLLAVAVVPKEG